MKNKTLQKIQFLLVFPVASYSSLAFPEEFNMQFVRGGDNIKVAQQVSLGQEFQPGVYPLDIYLNEQMVDNLNVTFLKDPKTSEVTPCFTIEQLHHYGIIVPAPLNGLQYVSLKTIIPDSVITTDASLQRINLSIPQSNLQVIPRGTVPERLWDNGINAGFVNYNISYTDNKNHSNGTNDGERYTYTSLSNGLNLGRWRFRQNSSYTHTNSSGAHWKNLASWMETDIPSIRGRLIVGQASTSNTVFDSFQFRGAQMSSVEDMLPDSMRNYAPVVRGIATSNARVIIKQNGYIVYSTNVSPGPFVIRDIYPNTSGDLYVTVIEADGSEKHFSVAYSSVTNLLRDGIMNYQLTAGRYHDGSTGYAPQFLQATIAQGISHDLTPFGGAMVADNYQSAVIGMGSSLGEFGGVSIDGSYARTSLATGETKQGASFRLLYAKSLNSFGTDFRLAGYRYSTSGYYDFNDAVQERRDWDNGLYKHDYIDPDKNRDGTPSWAEENNASYLSARYENKRSRMEVSINQSLNSYGRLFINANQLTYWGTDIKSHTVQLGYNNAYKKMSYSIYLQSTRSQYDYSDNSVNITLSLPFSWNDNHNMIVSSSQITHDQHSGDSYSTGISGTLLDDNRLSYGVNTGYQQSGSQTASANLGYQGSKGNINSSYSYSRDYSQKTLDVSGGIVAHSGGITLSQPLGNTFALVHADNANGVGVLNAPGVKIDHFGYAVVNNISPYRYNSVALDTEELSTGLDIPQSIVQTVPTEKAIVRVNFDTYYGYSLLIHSHLKDRTYPQIGSVVFNSTQRNSGTVGMNGDMYVSGVKVGEVITVKWGEESLSQCTIKIPRDLPVQTEGQGYLEASLLCEQ